MGRLTRALEDRRTIDVISAKFFPLCFKMAERFENLDKILLAWAKEKILKSLVDALNRQEKQEENKKPLLLWKITQKILEQSQSAVERDEIQNKIVSKLTLSKKPLLSLEYSKPDKQNVYDINLFQKFSVSK